MCKITLPTPSPVEHSLLDKISAAYNGYRRSEQMKMSQATEMVQGDPRSRDVLEDGLENMFSKTTSQTPVATHDSESYLMGTNFSDRSLQFNTIADFSAVESNKDLLNGEEFSAQGF